MAGDGGEFFAGLRGLLAPSGQRRLRSLAKAILGRRALVGDRGGRLARGFFELAAQRARGLVDEAAQLRVARLEILRPRGARAVQRFALIGHLGDQRANAAFAVGIGALERGDLGADQGLQLGGAGQCPLDAVAHRGDFPAYRLGKRGDLLARCGFGLRQPQRDPGDRTRRDAQFLHPARQRGEAEKKDRRSERRQGEQDRFRPEQSVARGRQVHFRRGQAQNHVDRAERQPNERRDGGRHERRPARTARLQGLNDRADRGPIVVGGRRPGAENAFALPALRRLAMGDRRRLAGVLRRQRVRGRGQRRRDGGRGPAEVGVGGGGGGGGGAGIGGRGRSRADRALVGGQAQSLLDSRHRRGDRVMGRLFLRHCVRLVRSVATGHGRSQAPLARTPLLASRRGARER